MNFKSAVGLFMALLFLGTEVAAQPSIGLVAPTVQPPTEFVESPVKARAVHQRLVPKKVALPQMLSSAKSQDSPTPPGTPRQIGERRDVEPLNDVAKTSMGLQWVPTTQGGWIAAISINSPQARGARLGILVRTLPQSATLRFYAPDSPTAFEISGAAILKLIQANIDSGDTSDAARTFWGPTIYGENTTIEIELPIGVNKDEVRIAIPTLSHFFISPLEIGTGNQTKYGVQIGGSASCNVDTMCSSETAIERRSVAYMQFVQDGNSFKCTGNLLTNKSKDRTPYFLSANHCISKQTVASTLNTYWFYHSTACNSGVLNPAMEERSGGATLLYASDKTDTAFMRLNEQPPAGAVFAGWGAAPDVGAEVIGLHNPQGDLQKVSQGTVSGFYDCTVISPTSGRFQCSSVGKSSGEFLDVRFNSGVTEPGSSGSGLFKTVNGVRYLVGQLYGGGASCSNPSGTNYYGRFDFANSSALSQWLDSGEKFLLSVSKNGNGAGIVSEPSQLIACGNTCKASYLKGATINLTATAATGSIFSGWSGACFGPSPICTVSMNSAQNVSANFSIPFVSLNTALDNSNVVFTNSISAPWFGQANTSNYGGSSAQTGSIGSSQSTSLTATLQGPGTLTFDWKVSSEKDYDVFSAKLDGIVVWSWSGSSNWATSSINVPAGTHTVQWTYAKDSSYSSGADAGWLDRIIYTRSVVSNIIQNPGFESGSAAWTQSTANGLNIISDYSFNSASINKKYAWLCGYESCKDVLAQVVSIPSDATNASVSYWVKVLTSVSVGYDALLVEIYDAITNVKYAVLQTLSNLGATYSWNQLTFDLTQYIGKQIKLVFTGTTSATSDSSFDLDDVSLLVTKGVVPGFKLQNGWYWNPNEGGRGFAIEQVGDRLFMAGFLYEASGQPTWFTASGPMVGRTFTAPMTNYAGGQTLQGPYKPPSTNGSSGNISLNFSDTGRAQMVWPGGSVALQRFDIVPGGLGLSNPAFVPERGWWWNAAEGGRGFALEVQGNNFFIAGFMYDKNGLPVWYVSTGKMSDTNTYFGNWVKYSGGQSMLGSYKSPSSNVTIEPVAIYFSDPQNAKLYLQSGQISLTRFKSF